MIPLNRSQCHGLDLDRHLVVDAGAGTGKTTVMSIRYIEHLLCEDQRASRLLPKGPREPSSGQGALRIPHRQQQELAEWNGLLPSECVAITFTVKAAAELKERIRSILSTLASTADGEPDTRMDPRLRQEGFVEQLTSSLDSAPIGTIDSFLSSLVSPHLSLVREIPGSQTMAEEEGPLLNRSAINLLWCLQSEYDGLDVGMTGDVLSMLQARDRLANSMAGRRTAGRVIEGLIKQSLFVEQAERAWRRRERNNSGNRLQTVIDVLLSMVPDVECISDLLSQHGNAWLDAMRSQSQALGLAEGLAEDSRFRTIDELLDVGPGERPGHRLLWCHHLIMAMCSMKQYFEPSPKVLPSDMPPKGNQAAGWPAGVKAWGSIPAASRDEVRGFASVAAEELRSILSTPTGNRLRVVARAAALFDDSEFPNPAPLGSKMNPESISELPNSPVQNEPRLDASLQMDQVEDLFMVLRAVDMIRSQMKRQAGIHDHSDMQRMAEDLLLTRCPDVCRFWYPEGMVDALDEMEEPWQDSHIERALHSSDATQKASDDLNMRLALVKRIRRRFRAFIIDEFQDTNPQQWRLLARLWGRRHLDKGEVEAPVAAWDPTVCLVGDVKQSIYRFRQAQVTVMHNAISVIREINRHEGADESRIQDLRSQEMSRDTRPRGGGWAEQATFITADLYEPSTGAQQHCWWRYDLEDDGSIATADVSRARAEGHIDLSTNHRTQEGLLETINTLCNDVFSPRHHRLEGRWYAEAQPLKAYHKRKRGNLEWLLPVPTDSGDPGPDLSEVLDPFSSPRAKSAHLENEMIAQRLYCLINGISTRIGSEQAQGGMSWVQLPTSKRVAAEDILVLLPTRTHIDDLMKRLEGWGIPATADKMGPLLERPAVRALRTLVGAVSDPSRRDLVVAMARSNLLGWGDSRLTAALSSQGPTNPFIALIEGARDEVEANLIRRWYVHARAGNVLSAVEEAITHSDLLLAWPEPSARNEVEMFLDLLRGLIQTQGGDAARIHLHLENLSALGKDGPSAKAPAIGGCVRLMTIHGSKGLQAQVVVIAGLFEAGKRAVSNTTRGHLIVTPELIAGRMKPWRSGKLSPHGLWLLAESLLEAQSEAEVRRLLYVSMTRVQSHLILVGSPGEATLTETGSIQARHRPSARRSMGTMWLDALRAASFKAEEEGSPWLIPGDEELTELESGSPERTLFLNPAALRSDSRIGVADGPRLTIYHHPDCFITGTAEAGSLLQRMRIHERGLVAAAPTVIPRALMKRRRRIRLAPSSVDTAASCLRRHWLESHNGWPSEPLGILREDSAGGGLPDPATLGTLFHRLVEVGLSNPSAKLDSTPALPDDWMEYCEDRLLDEEVLQLVLGEYSSTQFDHHTSKQRLSRLGEILLSGKLGQACSSGLFNGWKVEGLRTEMPFDLGLCTAADIPLQSWSPHGPLHLADIDTVITSLTGSMDLVLALGMDDGSGAYLVVDLKTRGCGRNFNPTDADSGHPAQRLPAVGEEMTKVERELLVEHKMQLSLYALALESMERGKPEGQRRKVLPPALYVAANGRLIAGDAESMAEDRVQLLELLSTLSRMKVSGVNRDEVERLSGDAATVCADCPHQRGRIRLCGPLDTPLGIISEQLSSSTSDD